VAQTIGQHSVAAFTSPVNGDPLNATVVVANDNSTRSAYVDHDSDTGIHVQSSLLAARPAASTAGRKWLTTDPGDVSLWFDTGTAWEEIAYVPSVGGNAATATALQTARNINGVAFDGTANITITAVAAAGSLTGATLASNVLASSLTSVGSLTALTVAGTTTIQQVLEKATVSATAATGVINYDALTQAVLFYTSNASANWTPNFRGDSGTTLASMMAVGQSITLTFMVTQGTTAYYASAHQIDGSSVTPKWQGGTAPTAGNASSIDIYTYVIIKTAATPTYTVLASQTKFA
jgi:hypothetical protein